jgi:hypothetical protein
LHQHIDGVELDGLVLRVGLAGLDQNGQRVVELAFGDQGGRLLAQVDLFRAFRQGDAVEEGANLAFGMAPLNSSTSWPWNSTLTDGMLRTPKCWASSGLSSELTLARMKRPLYSSASFSSIGLSTLHGSHHGAQKSTTTGTVSAGIRTLASNSSMETSNANSDMVMAWKS